MSEYVYGKVAEQLRQLKPGERINDILSKCTICPTGDGTCKSYSELDIYGFNSDKKCETIRLTICMLGVMREKRCPQIRSEDN
jgi:hypothetical protein